MLNDKNRELNLVIVALALTACHILGIDTSAALQLMSGGTVIDKDTLDILAVIKEAHVPVEGGGNWQSIVGMWIGVGIFSAGRVWLKGKVAGAEEK